MRAGLSSDDREALKQLKKENRELKRANEILRKASAYFAQAALDQGFEHGLTEIQRWFLYMPFQHSERLDDQLHSLILYDRLSEGGDNANSKGSAQRHYEIVARFGRFPHRNQLLNRDNTAEEDDYLAGDSHDFGQGG